MILKRDITAFDFHEGAIIWDVRDAAAYAEGHVHGAVNRPLNTLDDACLASVAVDCPIYLVCGGGSKAPRAAEKLEALDAGREYVVLMGGTRAARAAGMPVVSSL